MSVSPPWDAGRGLEAAVRRMPVAVLVVEATSLKVVELNDAARRLAVDQLGLAPSESLTGQWEICHPDGTP